MPNIPQYDAGQLGLQPSDRAAESSIQAGRRIGANLNETGEAVTLAGHRIGSGISEIGKAVEDYNFHQEQSEGYKTLSQIMLARTTAWQERIKDPATRDDPSLQAKFAQESEDIYDQFRQSFSTKKGQEWADHRIAATREHFNTTTTADIASIAGVKAHNNLIEGLNLNVAVVDKDPTALVAAANLWNESIAATLEANPGITGAQKVKFETDMKRTGLQALVQAAVKADIRSGGDGTRISDDPQFAPYINAQERQQFVTMQRQEQRLVTAEARAQKQWAKEEAQFKSDDTVVKMWQNLSSPKPSLSRQDLNDAVDAGQLTRRDYEHMIGVVERQTKDEPAARVSQRVWSDLTSRMYLPEGDPNKITAITDILQNVDKLRKDDFNDLVKKFQDGKTEFGQKLGTDVEHFLQSYKASISKSMLGNNDGFGDAQFFKFRKDVEQAVEDARRSGGPDAVRKLLKPGSTEFLGNPDNIMRYIAPLDQTLRENAEKLRQGTRPPLSSFGKP